MQQLKSRLVVANDVMRGGLGTDENTVLIVTAKNVRKVESKEGEIAKAAVEEIARL